MANLIRLQQLDLNLLKVFAVLYREQSIALAAEQLSLTASAVSHALRRLRALLDDELFVHANKRMNPTPACHQLAPVVLDTLAKLEHTFRSWGHFEPLTSNRHFRIGIHDAIEPRILPPLCDILAKHAPQTRFSSVKFKRASLGADLYNGKLDFAIDVPITPQQNVVSQTLSKHPFVVMLNKRHPKAKTLSKTEYLEATHILVSNRPSGMTAEDSLFQQQGIARIAKLRCQSYQAARELLKHSDYLLTLPDMIAEQLLESDLTIHPIPFTLQPVEISLYWSLENQSDSALAWLRKKILAALKNT